MFKIENDRAFQLWYFHVSHATMIIRQPKNCEDGYNLDYYFGAVEYVNFPTIMHNLVVSLVGEEKSKSYFDKINLLNGKAFIYKIKLYELKCNEGVFYVVSGFMKKYMRQCEMMDVSFYNPLA